MGILILAHLGTGGGGAIGLIFRCGEGTKDAARRSAASLAGDGTPGPPELNFLQLNLNLVSCPVYTTLRIMNDAYMRLNCGGH